MTKNPLPIGHPARSPDWPKVKALMEDGDLCATLLDAFALYHPVALDAAKKRMEKMA